MRAALATLAAALLPACAQPATEAVASTLAPAPMKLSPEQPSDWSAREAAVDAELRELGPHPWAGVYQRSDLFDVHWTLKVAPHAGFIFRWAGCTGVTDRNMGAVREENGVLTLECAWPNVPDDLRGFPERFTVVPWGERVYLADNLAFFCSEVNAGHYPYALLREGGGREPFTGKPRVPPQFERFLLPAPLHARVTAVGAPEYLDDRKPSRRRTRVTLDAGSAEGAYVGLFLFTKDKSGAADAHLDIVELSEHGSVAEIEDTDSAVHRLPDVGELCATRWE